MPPPQAPLPAPPAGRKKSHAVNKLKCAPASICCVNLQTQPNDEAALEGLVDKQRPAPRPLQSIAAIFPPSARCRGRLSGYLVGPTVGPRRGGWILPPRRRATPQGKRVVIVVVAFGVRVCYCYGYCCFLVTRCILTVSSLCWLPRTDKEPTARWYVRDVRATEYDRQ